MNVPDVAQKREEWVNNLTSLDKNHLVFLDESGVNTDLTQIYGRTIDGKRCVDSAPINTPQNTTILSSIILDGTTYQGGTTKDKFIDYLKDILAPILRNGDIVIMDNMRTHHSKEVKKCFKI